MLKTIVLFSLFSVNSGVFAQELTMFQCHEVRKLAHLEYSETDFSILSSRISRKNIELTRQQGAIKSQVAYKAEEMDMSVSDYATKLYNESCQGNNPTAIAQVDSRISYNK